MSDDCAMCGGTGWAAVGSRGVAACLCAKGRRKVDAGMRGIETCMTPEALRQAYGVEATVIAADTLTERLLRAGVPQDAVRRSLATFLDVFKSDPLSVKYGGAYADLWLKADPRADLVLYGNNGTGKSGLATALLRACIERRESGRWVSVPRLMLEWRECFDPEARYTERELLDALLQPKVLVLDEITGTQVSDFCERMLTLVVDERQKLGRPTILTLNTPSDLAPNDDGMYLTTLLGPTMFDRLRERGQFWPMRGRSKRQPLWKPPR